METFHFIDSLLDVAIPNLPIKTEMGKMETGSINRAAAAMTKAACISTLKSYTARRMYAEAAPDRQDILDGQSMGAYELDADLDYHVRLQQRVQP